MKDEDEDEDEDMREIYNEHDFDASKPFLKLLWDGESFVSQEVTVPEGFPEPDFCGLGCNSCLSGQRFYRAKDLVWHIRSK